MKSCQLNVRAVNAAKAPGYYSDGSGLYLQVSRFGSKNWVFRFTSPVHGRVREMGLGSLKDSTLKEARGRVRSHRQQLLDGLDPIDARRQRIDKARAEAGRRITVKDAALHYIKANEKGWKNPKHRQQWRSTLETYVFPKIGSLPIDAIELPHVLKVLEPIWHEKTETASRVRSRIERVLAWATVSGYRKGDNPARWDKHLSEVLPSKASVANAGHHPAMPFSDLPQFMVELAETKGISARALEFTILTAARTTEAIEARWEEIDLDEAVWNVPGARTKSGRDHRVPLNKAALAILKALPRDSSGYVFPGNKKGKPLSNMAMRATLQSKRGAIYTVHGFRSSFSDWARDKTKSPRDIVEMSLAHIIKDKSEAAYRRGDALEKRRPLMAKWSIYCSSILGRASNV